MTEIEQDVTILVEVGGGILGDDGVLARPRSVAELGMPSSDGSGEIRLGPIDQSPQVKTTDDYHSPLP